MIEVYKNIWMNITSHKLDRTIISETGTCIAFFVADSQIILKDYFPENLRKCVILEMTRFH